ncbi:MAG: hypothetical protein HEP71_03660 [Roseivirga sp.]|nr:hypothetical protein [Roseivirga sp.]
MSITAAGCQDVQDFGALKKVDELTLHKLGPVTGNDAAIIAEREVVSSVLLYGADKKDLIKVILDKSNYLPVSRRCLMAPAYALEADGKVVALFDPQFCPRIRYMGDTDEVEFDIKTENSMLAVLEKIYADR